MPYTTKQQQAVLRCLELRKEESLTAADLAEDLRQMGCPVGLATIYRQLEKLSAAGVAISHLDAVVEVHEAYAVARVQVNHRRLGKAVAQKSEYRKFGVYIVLAELQLESGRRSFPHAVHLP